MSRVRRVAEIDRRLPHDVARCVDGNDRRPAGIFSQRQAAGRGRFQDIIGVEDFGFGERRLFGAVDLSVKRRLARRQTTGTKLNRVAGMTHGRPNDLT